MRKFMRHTLRTVTGNQRGIVLVIALMLMGLMAALAAVYSKMILADVKMTGGAGQERKGFYAAEAGLNYAMNDVRALFASFTPPAHYSGSVNVGSGAAQRAVDYEVEEVPGQNPGPTQVIPAGQQFAGMTSIPSQFTVTATAENTAGDEESKLGAEFTIYSVPIFQFLAYYANNLEILPGANMTLSGRVHTNGNLYLNSDATLFIGDRLAAPVNRFVQISAAGSIFRGRLNTSTCGSNVVIDMLRDTNQAASGVMPASPIGDLDPRLLLCVGSGTTQVPTATIAAYRGSLIENMTPLQVPNASTLERSGSPQGVGAYWDNADLRIVLNIGAVEAIPWAAVCSANAPNIGAPPLFPIEVQTAAGGRDVGLTNSLWQFMCERRGAIFYNDLPTNRPAATITPIAAPAGAAGAWPTFANIEPSNPDNYNPRFGRSNLIRATGAAVVVASGNGGTEADTTNPAAGPFGPIGGANDENLRAMVQWERAQRVYRRAGEDTNGDGVVDISGSTGTAAAAITNNDRNDDICPVPPSNGVGAAGARPWWRPDFCNQARLHQTSFTGANPAGTNGGGVRAPGNVEGWPAAATVLTAAQAPGVLNTPAWYRDMDYRRGGFFNWRENRWMYMLNVNLRALIDWNEVNGGPLFAPNDATDGGLVIFLSVQANNSQTSPPTDGVRRYGVRVFDSADLNTRGGTFPWPVAAGGDPTGVTVVSDQAVYVQGNYNFVGTAANLPWYPAAIMGDTINVLSQSWEVPSGPAPLAIGTTFQNDRKTMANLSTAGQANRVLLNNDNYFATNPNFVLPAGTAAAAAFTNVAGCTVVGGVCGAFNNAAVLGINAAFLSRVDNTVGAAYNGGLENYPRFHENWGGFTLNYRGSYVSLGTPLYSSGAWANPGVFYNPPARVWDYESQFNNPVWLPPMTPQVHMVQQQVYTRFYK
jgi:Tfp pilus assembly protein PilX